MGGYLLFGSLLLAVILAGIRLFVEEETASTGARTVALRERDPDALRLELDTGFRTVPSGPALWGVYDLDHRDEDDNPAPLVPKEYLVDDPFDMAIHEVTNDQYYEFLLAWAQRTELSTHPSLLPRHWKRSTGRPRVPRIYDRGQGNHPVTSIRWEAALEFCAWFWEENLGADPDLIVDLPTELEFVRAGRGDHVERNFPWGPERDRDRSRPDGYPATVLSGDSLPVNHEAVGRYGGFFGLVGNAAEWVHGDVGNSQRIAAGWSFAREGTWESDARAGARQTPFGDDMAIVDAGERQRHIGFRIVIRHAPAVPQFRRVSAGPVRHREPPPSAVLTPLDRKGNPEPPIRFAVADARVSEDFEVTRTEITNHQYLSFLVDLSNRESPERIERLLPGSFNFRHPLLFGVHAEMSTDERERALQISRSRYYGSYGPPIALPDSVRGEPRFAYVYDPGESNLPVSAISLAQAEAYADWLRESFRDGRHHYRIPTVREFVRAARGESGLRYPWGDDPNDPELICEGFRYSESRPVSLLGRLGTHAPDIVGLAGNVLEFVRESDSGRLLRAGGCFVMPAEDCTIDSFLDADWASIDVVLREGDNVAVVPVRPARLTGFRIVRQLQK
jgi:formylglycine-generating enzyme required for sulfatase activity